MSSVFLMEFGHDESLQQPSETLDKSFDEDHWVIKFL